MQYFLPPLSKKKKQYDYLEFHDFFMIFFYSYIQTTDIVSSKFGMSGPQLGQSISQQGFFSTSRESLAAPCVTRTIHTHVSATASEMDLTRKNRKTKESSRLKQGEQPLLGSWNRTGGRESNANTLGTLPSSNHLNSANSCNGTDR